VNAIILSMRLVLLAIGMCLYALPSHSAINVVYPKPESASDPRQDYPAELLDLVLKQSGKDYQLRPSDHVDTQLRALKNVESGKDLDVVWSATSIQREKHLRAIRIPIDKGLLGWRVPLIRQSDIARFNAISTRQDIQALSAGQGHDWPDVNILRHNNFKVVSSSSYSGLFKMLAFGRIDYFPRSITEAWTENEHHVERALMVDPNVLIIYPGALYFFVNAEANELARDIEQGLESLIASGEFDALFDRHYGDYVKRSNLAGRKIFHLENPLLPAQTPLHRQELWYQLAL
jgi:hypothetical protein